MDERFNEEFLNIVSVPWKRLTFSIVFVGTVCLILAAIITVVLAISKYLFLGLILVAMVVWIRNLNRALTQMYEEEVHFQEMLNNIMDKIENLDPEEEN